MPTPFRLPSCSDFGRTCRERLDLTGRVGLPLTTTPLESTATALITAAVAEIANNRAVIDQAKGMLILVYGVEEDGAFEEQSSIPVDQDLLCGLLGSGGV